MPGVENPCLKSTTVQRTGHVRLKDACFFWTGTFSTRKSRVYKLEGLQTGRS
jgi:hypothetical protein